MLKLGIVGLPNVGKSTLFKAMTKKQIDIQNYPFTTIDPNVGVVAVPDERLDLLAKMSNSAKVVPTAIEFIDIAGLVKGAAQGEGLGNKFLANIREVDAIAEVVRVFPAEDGSASGGEVTHVHNRIDPVGDIEIINTELMLADLETVTKRTDKTKGVDEKTKIELDALSKLKSGLESGRLAIDLNFNEKEASTVRELNLLTNKKFIYILNASEDQLKNSWKPGTDLLKTIGENEYVVLSNTFELLLSESSPEEQKIYLEEIGKNNLPVDETGSGLDELIKKAYSALGLITFLTTGEDETRAWTTKAGSTAPQAARAIHTDFEQKFIRAEVINWKTLLDVGNYVNARSKGLVKTVGKDYIVQDGDVMEIRI